MNTESEKVLVERLGRVALVTLDDPDRRNALGHSLVSQFGEVVDELATDDGIGAVVVTGAGKAFCAGGDLEALRVATPDDLRAIYEGFLKIARNPLPTIAAVNGAAVGAGLNLALACDLRIAGERARFEARFMDLGIHPGGGNTWMLRHAIGPQGTAAMLLFGEALDGRAAEEAGLAWRCVPDDELLPTAIALAEQAASAPRELIVELKKTMRDGTGITTLDEAVEREIGPQAWSKEQTFFAERLAAIQRRISKQPS